MLFKGHGLVVELVPFEPWERQVGWDEVIGGDGEERR